MNTPAVINVPKQWALGLLSGALALIAAMGMAACGDGGQPSGSPVPTQLVRGQEVFTQYCTTCHPGGGAGRGPSLITQNLSTQKIETTVRNGRGLMPGFGTSSISDDDLAQLVQYIQSLHQ
jgi:mono/diheme cytochrome c family protein